ncbi:MAG: accessory gene regulator B family protein [Clostridium sp.]|nr:accessory gene regulator B family protein [Clostridium sp.]
MFEKLSCKITDKLEENGTVSKPDRELYEYGLRQMLMTLLNVATALLIGLAMDMTSYAVIFISAYIPVRIYAGGFHASTFQRCWAFSAVMLAAALFAVEYVPEEYFWAVSVLSLAACAVIVILSPVEDENKPLDQKEKHIYHVRTIWLLSVEIVISGMLIFLGFRKIAMTFEIVWLTLSIMLIAGKVKNGIIAKRKKEEMNE